MNLRFQYHKKLELLNSQHEVVWGCVVNKNIRKIVFNKQDDHNIPIIGTHELYTVYDTLHSNNLFKLDNIYLNKNS